MAKVQKISTCLWFDTQAEEAAQFYTSLFENSRITNVSRYGPDAPMPEGTAMLVLFTLDGAQFGALNGGPMFKPNEACSLVVNCDTQEEIDRLWTRLTENGGAPGQCGWLKDRYGFSWQIVASGLLALMFDPDHAAAKRVWTALMPMKKLDIAKLEAAHRGQ